MKIMKTKNMLLAALSMTAALVMTACSSDNDLTETPACSSDNDLTETPAAPQAQKTIPYTVTVSDDAATTRATVSDDPTNRQLYFATGDKLYITGADIKGVLDLQAGDEGKTTGATFSGELAYTGSGSPADDLELTATLVSAQQTVGTEVTVDDAGTVTVNYPTAAYCATISDAVQQYSRLTGTSTYGDKAFTLTQQTAFLNFVITFEDGTTAGTTLSAAVSNNNATVCTADVTTETESEKVVAKFVLPVAAGTTLSSATVTMDTKDAIEFGASQTLTGKVYNVRKTQASKTLAEATTDDIGKIAGKDGKIYATKADAEAVATGNAVAMIAYVGSDNGEAAPYNHGLALALSDANGGTAFKWKTSNTYADGHTLQLGDTFTEESGLQYNAIQNTDEYPAFQAAIANNGTAAPTGCSSWFLASGYQWKKMAGAVGGYSNLGLYANAYYWSSSEQTSNNAWHFNCSNGFWWESKKTLGHRVRACLAF